MFTKNRLNQSNRNVLSPNSFEQLTAWDDVKETVNGEKYNDNSWHDSTRALIHTDINLNDKFNNCILIYYSPSPEFNTNIKYTMALGGLHAF